MSYKRALILLFLVLAAVRLSAPSDLLEGDQEKQIGYVMDVLHHGNWLTQYEINGKIATKPPVYNWMAAAVCQVCGTRAPWAMKLPSLLGGIGLTLCLYWIGSRLFDERVAFYGCAAALSSHHFLKLTWFARTDMLVTFWLHLAIALQVGLRPSYRKSLLIGLVIAVSALTKGPIGPCLFLLFLFAWNWHQQTLRSRGAWLRFLPGCLLCLAVSGAWLAAVWDLPQFKERVIYWQLGTRMADESLQRPGYYYVFHLLTRIFPWSVVAAVGVWRAREREEWRTVRFMLLWGGLFFLFFSASPVKRHDHLFPVYPAFYLLAGLGLRYAFEPILTPASKWLLYPLCGWLFLMPLALGFTQSPGVAVLVLGSCACGVATLWWHGQGRRLAFQAAMCGLICSHGIYHHWLHQEGRAHYDQVRRFVAEVREITGEDDVTIFQAYPLIAYELDQHVPLESMDQLKARRPRWLIAPYYWRGDIQGATQWQLHEQASLWLLPREDQATLYRIADPPTTTATLPTDRRTN